MQTGARHLRLEIGRAGIGRSRFAPFQKKVWLSYVPSRTSRVEEYVIRVLSKISTIVLLLCTVLL